MPFVACFGFLLPVLVFPAPMSIFYFCSLWCFSSPVVALSDFSLLLMSTIFQLGPELKQMNENRNEKIKCSLLLFLVLGHVFSCHWLLLLLFVAHSCF